jgi:hypothetical protein
MKRTILLLSMLLFLVFTGCEKLFDGNHKTEKHANAYFPVPTKIKGTKSLSMIEDTLIINDTLSFYPLTAPMKNGLTLYYTFSDSAQDQSVNHLDGTVIKMNSNTKIGSTFNSMVEPTFIEVDDPNNQINKGHEFSLCAWYNNTYPSDDPQGIISRPYTDTTNGYSLTLSKSGREINFVPKTYSTGNGDTSSVMHYYLSHDGISPNGWHFVVIEYGKKIIPLQGPCWIVRLFVDGAIRDSALSIPNNTSFRSSLPLYIGKETVTQQEPWYYYSWIGASENYFYGGLDNIMVYNKMLSDVEVQALYKLRKF